MGNQRTPRDATTAVVTIDTGHIRTGLAACHLLVRGGRAAFVDAGTNRSVPVLLDALRGAGLTPGAVDFIILTHVHLDHAGGAGALAEVLPGATVVTHPRGAPNLVDPSRLEAGARAVHGDDAFDAHYGRLVPVPADRVRVGADGDVLELGGTPLRLIDAPGHALHHLAVVDAAARAAFTGDAFGLAYPQFTNDRGEAFVIPTTSPTQFDPSQTRQTVLKIRNERPDVLYLAHFGRVEGVDRLADDFLARLDRFVALAAEAGDGPDAEDRLDAALHAEVAGWLAAHGSPTQGEPARDWLAMDLRLSAAGLLGWRRRAARG